MSFKEDLKKAAEEFESQPLTKEELAIIESMKKEMLHLVSINGKLLGKPVTLQVEIKKSSGALEPVVRLDKIKDYFTEEDIEILSLYFYDTLNMDIFSVFNPFNKRLLRFTVVL